MHACVWGSFRNHAKLFQLIKRLDIPRLDRLKRRRPPHTPRAVQARCVGPCLAHCTIEESPCRVLQHGRVESLGLKRGF